MKEYGGYLPLELGNKGEYFENKKDIIRLNCGRSAIAMAMQHSDWDKLYIPYYMCKSVLDMCDKNAISYELYHIDSQFNPIDVKLKEKEAILIPNYFGIFSDLRMENMIKQYGRVIVDNTQAFFARPQNQTYNIYSCRKFIGVADGAYLIKKNIGGGNIPKDEPGEVSSYLLEAIDVGTNAVYTKYLENEKRIENANIRRMSRSTLAILKSVDYDSIKAKRISNYYYMAEKLSDLNELKNVMIGNVPMVYPLLIQKDGLRNYLIENKIYVPQWWKWLLECDRGNEFEKTLAEYLLPLPIDQRYSKKDMKFICDLIINFLEG